MAATFGVIGSFFAGGAAEAGIAGVAAAGAGDLALGAATADALVGAGATVAEGAAAGASLAGSVGGAAAATGAVAGGSILGTLGTGVATALGSQLVGAALAPKAPKTLAPSVAAAPAVPTMPDPDPLAQQQAVQQSIVSQLARRGRASTVLTNSGGGAGSGKLGG